MELQVREPQQQNLEILNFEELKTEITEGLKKYKDLQYTDEQIAEAKKDRAKLNSFRNLIEDKRKEVKKQCLEPYNSFEAQAKELVAMVDQPIRAIDTQIKEYEAMKKSAKKEDIQQIFDEAVGELFQVLPLEKIFNEKWLNTSASMTSIKKEINEIIKKVSDDLLVIGSYESEFKPMMREHYLKHLDLSAAIQECKRLEEIKKADAQQHPAPVEEAPKHPEIQEASKQQEAPKNNKIYTISFEVCGTYDEIMALKAYLESQNLQYRRVRK